MEEGQVPSIMPVCIAQEVKLSLQTALHPILVIVLVDCVNIFKMLVSAVQVGNQLPCCTLCNYTMSLNLQCLKHLSVKRQTYDWLVGLRVKQGQQTVVIIQTQHKRAEWRFVSMECGELFVMRAGIP